MISFFTTEVTPRIEYITDLVFTKLLNTPYQLFTNPEEFNNQKGIKLNYSNETKLKGEFIKPVSLLFENSLFEKEVEIGQWNELPTLYPTESTIIPFDIFAASFYLVSRYEEYFPGKKDHYGRFRAESSIAYKNKFLQKPLVNTWCIQFAQELQKRYPEFKWNKPAYKYQPTIDIDNAFAFKHKGFFRNAGSAFRDLKNRNWHAIATRIKVLLRIERDPYDSYKFIQNLMTERNLEPKFFILLNNKGKRDRSLSPNRSSYKKLIQKLNTIGEVGIHPSYQSNKDKELLKKEISKLGAILKKEIQTSRQHYLKYSIPNTYRELEKNKIEHEFSMGYAQRPGFRASISIEYNFFDLILNQKTNLVIHPFQVMDGTLKNYMNINQDEALDSIKSIINQTKQAGGTFTTIWHNESLSDRGLWKGWQNLYIEMTKMAVE